VRDLTPEGACGSMNAVTQRVAGSLLVALSIGAGGCQSLATGAKEAFAKKYSCPADRVVVRKRGDVRPSQIYLDNDWTPGTPPEEVASDPGRLSVWRRERAKSRQQRIDSYDHRFNHSITVFEVGGCGHTAFMGCYHPQRGYAADCKEGHEPVEIPAPG